MFSFLDRFLSKYKPANAAPATPTITNPSGDVTFDPSPDIQWTAQGGPDVKYDLAIFDYTSGSGNCLAFISDLRNNHYQTTNLPSGHAFSALVTAKNPKGESNQSANHWFTTLMDTLSINSGGASLPEGTTFSSVAVNLACNTENVSFIYTLDGSDAGATLHNGSFETTGTGILNNGETISLVSNIAGPTYPYADLRAVAVKVGWDGVNSQPEIMYSNTVEYSIAFKCDPPSIDIPTGTYGDTFGASLSAPAINTDATIWYTTDGSTPSATNGVSTGSSYGPQTWITQTGTTVKAIAVKDGFQDSDILEAVYTLQCPPPNIWPGSGTYNNITSISADGGPVHFSISGSTCGDTMGGIYAIGDGVTVSGYRIGVPGFIDSNPSEITIHLQCGQPQIQGAGETVYYNAQTLNITTGTNGYSIETKGGWAITANPTIYYSFDGMQYNTFDPQNPPTIDGDTVGIWSYVQMQGFQPSSGNTDGGTVQYGEIHTTLDKPIFYNNGPATPVIDGAQYQGNASIYIASQSTDADITYQAGGGTTGYSGGSFEISGATTTDYSGAVQLQAFATRGARNVNSEMITVYILQKTETVDCGATVCYISENNGDAIYTTNGQNPAIDSTGTPTEGAEYVAPFPVHYGQTVKVIWRGTSDKGPSPVASYEVPSN